MDMQVEQLNKVDIVIKNYPIELKIVRYKQENMVVKNVKMTMN